MFLMKRIYSNDFFIVPQWKETPTAKLPRSQSVQVEHLPDNLQLRYPAIQVARAFLGVRILKKSLSSCLALSFFRWTSEQQKYAPSCHISYLETGHSPTCNNKKNRRFRFRRVANVPWKCHQPILGQICSSKPSQGAETVLRAPRNGGKLGRPSKYPLKKLFHPKILVYTFLHLFAMLFGGPRFNTGGKWHPAQ